jgi:glycosyltransferase involved in cell wall biosynthesis
MDKNLKFSIIIPFQQPSEYLYECLKHLQRLSYANYEIILLPDKKEILTYHKTKVIPTGRVGPAKKRDKGVIKSSGDIVAFIDDDAYPDRDWLKNAFSNFQIEGIAAVCGPGVTPSSDDVFQKASGWVNQLWFGSGGAGTYRFTPRRKRFVDDFPSMNFLVRKEDFIKAGGFDTHFWPGEDTKLCHDLVYTLKKKIIYDPDVLVYHHRKPLFLSHLRQISRFAIHRGHFARILPTTSFRIGYLVPSLFVIFLFLGLFVLFLSTEFKTIYLLVMFLYLALLIVNILYVLFRARSVLVSILTGCGILLTHITYGLLFPVGFFKQSLKQ